MVFGLDPVKLAKKELLKVDMAGKKGVPDALEALDAAEAGLAGLANFCDGFEADEAEALLTALNQFRKVENRKSEGELKFLAAQVVLIPSALRKAKEVLDGVEAELKKE